MILIFFRIYPTHLNALKYKHAKQGILFKAIMFHEQWLVLPSWNRHREYNVSSGMPFPRSFVFLEIELLNRHINDRSLAFIRRVFDLSSPQGHSGIVNALPAITMTPC